MSGSTTYAYVGNNPVNFTDPSGNCPWCIGAVAGFGLDLAAQYVESRVAGKAFNYDWKRGLVATGTGALTGGVSAFVAKNVGGFVARTAANTVVGAVGNVGQTASLNGIEGKNESLATAAKWGAVFGTLGSVAGDAVGAGSAAIKQANLNKLSPGTRNFLSNIAESSGVDILAVQGRAATLADVAGNTFSNLSAFGSVLEGGGTEGSNKQTIQTFVNPPNPFTGGNNVVRIK